MKKKSLKTQNRKEYFYYIKDIDKKLKVPCKTIDLPLYHCKVMFIFDEYAQKLSKDWKKDLTSLGGVTMNYLKENGDVILLFPKKPDIPTVTHELHHTVDMIMDFIVHKKNSEYDEPSAYLIGYLMEEYLKFKNYD